MPGLNGNDYVQTALRKTKRLVVIVIGGTVLLLGVALLVLPGPGLLVVLAGLGILATEFVWARQLIKHVKQRANQMADAGANMIGWKRTPRSQAPPAPSDEPG